MYSEIAESRKTIGDVDILYCEGIYHLFHLVLPNHDYIAHAVSNDCFNWRRVENALHIGHPGAFDDSMLWTTHVSPNPHRAGWWRMFYTGLSRKDQGLIQRIGMAESDNLYCWEKYPVRWVDRRTSLPYDLPGRPKQPGFSYEATSPYPIEPASKYYESRPDEGRRWISWRDPFYFDDDGCGYLLIAGRVKEGPVVRRGCVALYEEAKPNAFEPKPALLHPGLYDDIEVPNLLKIEGEYYLLGSLREDAKVRYWHTSSLDQPWYTYADNVLLPGGNYAGRVCKDHRGYLLFSFFTPGTHDRTQHNIMPPPRRMIRQPNGELSLRTFEGFDSKKNALGESLGGFRRLRSGMKQAVQDNAINEHSLELCQATGFEIYASENDLSCFEMQAQLRLKSNGKCGLVFRLDRDSQDGYYLSLDLFKGVAQLRKWGSGPVGSGEEMMQFSTIQSGYWKCVDEGAAQVKLIAYGSYLELSIDGFIVLTCVDQTYSEGAVGFYVESARLLVSEVTLSALDSPIQSDEHLAMG